jgi:hypothetical protein
MLLTIFCSTDDFCKVFSRYQERFLLSSGAARRIKPSSLSLSEVMTIMIYFHISRYRTFKDYYTKHVCQHMREEFPGLVSYNRFVELMNSAMIPLMIYLQRCRLKKSTGVAFVDSTTLKVCHNRRIHNHKTFNGIAQRGKTSMGWFYGFKLHLIVNHMGDLVSVMLTPGNTDDRNLSMMQILTKDVVGKLFGDRGYISAKLFKALLQRGLQLITRLKKNMANKLMPLMDKLMLKKRALIESINDQLKNLCQIEHTRHRSSINFLGNLFSGLIAYTFSPQKPSIVSHDLALLNLCA